MAKFVALLLLSVIVGASIAAILERRRNRSAEPPSQPSTQTTTSSMGTVTRTPFFRVEPNSLTESPQNYEGGEATLVISVETARMKGEIRINIGPYGDVDEAGLIALTVLNTGDWTTRNDMKRKESELQEAVDEYCYRRGRSRCECGEARALTNDGNYVCPWCSRGIDPAEVVG